MLTDKGPLDGVPKEFARLDHPVWKKIAPKFTPKEFKEPEKMDAGFLLRLYRARILAGVPFRPISTVRKSIKSAHGEIPCCAIDLQVLNSYERSRVVRSCYEVGFIRVGVYPGTDGTYKGKKKRDGGGVHVDGSRSKPQDRMWTMKIRKAVAVLIMLLAISACEREYHCPDAEVFMTTDTIRQDDSTFLVVTRADSLRCGPPSSAPILFGAPAQPDSVESKIDK